MLKFFLLLFLTACSTLLVSLNTEDGEFPSGSTVSYQGLSFDCDYGCGNPYFDGDAKALQWLYARWLFIPVIQAPNLGPMTYL